MSKPNSKSMKQDIITNLTELLDFGYEKIQEIQFPQETSKLRESIVLQAMAACNHYSRAILILAKNGLIAPANALFRSIVELFFYVRYVVEDESNERAERFTVSSSFNKKKTVGHFLKLLIESKAPILDKNTEIKEWRKMEVKIEKEISEHKTAFFKRHNCKLKNLPDIARIAVQIDEDKQQPGAVETYRTVYWYLSTYVHLDSQGLDKFVKEENGKVELVLNSKSKDFENLVTLTYAHNIALLGECNKFFGIPSKDELLKFNKKLDLIDKEGKFHKK